MLIRQKSFAGGVINPDLAGRDDLAKYANSVRTLINTFVTKKGGLQNRPGLKYCGGAVNDERSRLVPFNFADGQNLVIEIGRAGGGGFLQFWKNGGVVQVPSAPAYAGGTTYAKGAYVASFGGAIRYRSLESGNIGNLPESSPTWWQPVGVIGVNVLVAHSWAAADLRKIKFVQSGDVLTLTCKGYYPRELRRFADDDWEVADAPIGVPAFGGVYVDLNVVPGSHYGPVTGADTAVGYAITTVSQRGVESKPLVITDIAVPTATANFPNIGIDVRAGTGVSSVRIYKGVSGVYGFLTEINVASVNSLPLGAGITFQDIGTITVDFSRVPPAGRVPFGSGIASWAQDTVYSEGQRVTANGATYEAIVGGRSDNTGTGPSGSSASIRDGAPDRNTLSGAKVIGDRCVCNGVTRVIKTNGTLSNVLFTVPDTMRFNDGSLTAVLDVTDGTAVWDVVDRRGAVQWQYVGQGTIPAGTPAAVAIIDQRMAYANIGSEVGRVVVSKVGDYHNFDVTNTGALPNDALDFNLDSKTYEEIRSLVATRALLALTSQTVPWSISGSGSNADNVLATGSVLARPQGYVGADWLDPLLVENLMLYTAAKGNSVRELIYDVNASNYQSTDLSVLADHLVEDSAIVEWCYAQAPNRIIWAVLDNGKLLGLTYLKEHEIIAWHLHETDGAFESVCAIQEGNEDAVYALVRRTVGGVTKRFIERFHTRKATRVNGVIDTRRGVFLDCSLSYDGAPATVFGGLNHLNGREVTVLADGAVLGPYTVASNQINIAGELEDGASIVHVGLPFTSTIEMLPPVIDKRETRASPKRIVQAVIETVDTRGLSVGTTSMAALRPRNVSDSYGVPACFTEAQIVPIHGAYGLNAILKIIQSDPLPFTILAVGREVDFGDS